MDKRDLDVRDLAVRDLDKRDLDKRDLDKGTKKLADTLSSSAYGAGGTPSRPFLLRLAGWGLTTAEILYRMPDHPGLLQTFIWQEYDLAPQFPTLKRFLTFWQEKLEGPLFSVKIGHERLLRPAEIRAVGNEFRIQ